MPLPRFVLEAHDAAGPPVLRVERRTDGGPPRLVRLGGSATPTVGMPLRRATLRGHRRGFASDTDWSALLLDFLPPAFAPAVRLRVEVDAVLTSGEWVVSEVRLSGAVRCLLGMNGGLVAVEARLTAAADKLEWRSLSLDSRGVDVRRPLADMIDTNGFPFTLNGGAVVPLLDCLGTNPQSLSVIAVHLVPAFLPAPRFLPDNDPDDQLLRPVDAADPLLVLQFGRTVALRQNVAEHRLRAGAFAAMLPQDLTLRARLHLPDPAVPGAFPLKLRQTHAAWAAENEPAPVNRWVARVEGYPTAALLPAFNRLATHYHDGLQSVDDGRAVSAVPRFDDRVWDVPTANASDDAQLCERQWMRPWLVTFDVADPPTPAATVAVGLQVGFRAALPVGPDVPDPLPISGAKLTEFLLSHRMWFPGLKRHDGDSHADHGLLTFDVRLLRPPQLDGKLDTGAVESVWRGFWFRLERLFRHPTLPAIDPQRLRFGALDFELATALEPLPATFTDGVPDTGAALAALKAAKAYGVPDAGIATDRTRCVVTLGLRDGRDVWSTDILQTALDLRLRVDRAEPGGEDGLPGAPFDAASAADTVGARFVREAPVIVPLGRRPAVAAPMLLVVRERTERGESRRLAMQLRQAGPGAVAALQPLLILDRHPFTVAKVWAPPLVGLAGADGNLEIGNWSLNGFEGASWELAGATDGFVVHFPPQAVGEGMEKRKGADIADGAVVPARLSPAARFELLASFFRQNFVEATWNLRRILGYPGQRAPGAGVRRLDFELLYGLGCTVRTEGLRLAELDALLGAIPGRLQERVNRPLGTDRDFHPLQDQAFKRLGEAWSRQYAAHASRLGVFQPWTEAQPQGLVLKTGVNYLLRPPGTLMQDPARPLPGDPRLPGGALWGLEFESAYAPFRDDEATRRSTAGELARPAFSALGGWGHQKAVFQDGLTTIYSDTAMGRTFFYSVERRGRIGCFWNFAKHVVVYERTVGTALQFRDEQDHHAGRPVLRKVREFVEIIQPVRRYPDFGDADVTRGFVTGIDFKTRIIPVTSAWGTDVPGGGPGSPPAGYSIPLWKADADPAIYPKPQVVLKVAGAGAKGEELAGSLDEPQKLVFFSTAASGAGAGPDGLDTDRWAAVSGVDYPDLAWPSAPPATFDPGANIEAQQPDEQTTAPGYDAYTHALTAPTALDVSAGRTERTVGAVIRNVSMVRANPLLADNSAAAADGTKTPALLVRRQLADAQAHAATVAALARAPLADAAGRQALEKALNDANVKLNNFQTNFTGAFGATAPVNEWQGRLAGGIQQWKTAANEAAKQTLAKLQAELAALPEYADPAQLKAEARRRIDGACEVFRLAVPPADGGLEALAERARAALNLPTFVREALAGVVGPFTDEVAGLLADLPGDQPPPADVLADLTGLVGPFTEALRRGLAAACEPVLTGVVRDLAGAAGDRIRAALAPVQALVTTFGETWRRTLALTADDILIGLDGLRTLVDSAFTGLTAAVSTVGTGSLQDVVTAMQGHLTLLKNAPFAGGVLKDVLGKDALDMLRNDLIAAVNGNATVAAIAAKAGGVLNAYAGLRDQLSTAPPNLANVVAALTGDGKLLNSVTPGGLVAGAAALAAFKPTTVPNIDEIRSQVDARLGAYRAELDRLAQNLAPAIAANFPAGLVQTAGTTLRLVRAFGDAPVAAGMAFNRERLGYFFLPENARAGAPVDLTPVTALVNRAGDQLKGLGISLPAGQLLDQVLPPELKDFDFGKLLPDFAGLRLDKLLPELKAPEGMRDKVKVTNSFDRATGRGWAQADVAIDAPEPTALFEAGPVKVSLRDVSFRARIRIEAGLSGSPKHTQSGKLLANWDLVFGGAPLVTFRETELSFDEAGRTRFTLDPTKIEMNGLLTMLSDVLRTVSDPNGGFTLRLKERDGLPVGVEAVLLLPLPDLTFGVCALTNLRFGAEVDLAALPEFSIGLRVHVGEKLAPVCVAILILAGGCWFDARARYLPLSGRTTVAVSIGLNAGAMLAISLGPIRGVVFAFLFVEGELRTDSGNPGSQQLIIRIGLLLGGDVDLLGLVTVSVRLILELEYDGEALTGRGTVSLKVKICWCFTISVSKTVEKKFIGASRDERRPDPNRVQRAADKHLGRTA